MALVPVVAIDGPSGSGKGTISRLLAINLGWNLLDSGAIYRVLAYQVNQQSINPEDVDALAQLVAGLNITFEIDGECDDTHTLLNGTIVDNEIRTEQCAVTTSRLAALPVVRKLLMEKQRSFRTEPGLIADGRDMASVIFPDALLKIYLDASVEERALRRYKQLIQKGNDANISALCKGLADRDYRDMSRKDSPLKIVSDATVIDTTAMSISAVVDKIGKILLTKLTPSINK